MSLLKATWNHFYTSTLRFVNLFTPDLDETWQKDTSNYLEPSEFGKSGNLENHMVTFSLN
jgi:hypothetical protein